MTINSPLEAHRANTLTYSLVAIDNGFENPIFAALECDMTTKEKTIAYYEMDLGLNHVVRKWSAVVENTANILLALPGGTDGPSGLIVCSQNLITWIHQNATSVSIKIPRRPTHLRSNVDNVIISSGVVHRLKKAFFVLFQTEDGDIFKVTLDHSAFSVEGPGSTSVENIKIKYFDTIPTANVIIVLKSGFLFSASETGNHGFYQIENLGDDDTTQEEYQSLNMPISSELLFSPRPLRNISLIEELESLSPLLDAKALNLTNDDNPQIYTVSGKGNRSALKIVKHGLTVNEVAVSELPANPTAVWTVRLTSNGKLLIFI